MEDTTKHKIVFSKGIHLIVPRLSRQERVLAFFDDTQRLFYVIPMGTRSMIGTTDERVTEPVTDVTNEDRDFLLNQINERLDLQTPLTPRDIISTQVASVRWSLRRTTPPRTRRTGRPCPASMRSRSTPPAVG